MLGLQLLRADHSLGIAPAEALGGSLPPGGGAAVVDGDVQRGVDQQRTHPRRVKVVAEGEPEHGVVHAVLGLGKVRAGARDHADGEFAVREKHGPSLGGGVTS